MWWLIVLSITACGGADAGSEACGPELWKYGLHLKHIFLDQRDDSFAGGLVRLGRGKDLNVLIEFVDGSCIQMPGFLKTGNVCVDFPYEICDSLSFI